MNKETSCILKGLCAIGVLVNHLAYWGGYSGISEYTHRLSDISMTGFLFISGYGCYLSWKNNGIINFWEKKIDRLLIPILCSNILGLLVEYVLWGGRTSYSRSEIWDGLIAREVYYPVFNGALWYIHFLVVWYFVFYVLYRFVNYGFIRLILWIILSGLIFYITPEAYGLANLYCLAFPMGVVYAKISKVSSRKLRLLSSIVAIVSLLYICNDVDMTICGVSMNFFVYAFIMNILELVAFLGIAVIAEWIDESKVKKLFLVIGQLSFGIYIYQTPVLKKLLMDMDLKANKIVVMIFGIILCVLLSYGTEKFVIWLNKEKSV